MSRILFPYNFNTGKLMLSKSGKYRRSENGLDIRPLLGDTICAYSLFYIGNIGKKYTYIKTTNPIALDSGHFTNKQRMKRIKKKTKKSDGVNTKKKKKCNRK